MLVSQKRRRVRRVLWLGALGLGLYFFLIYRPLSRQAAELDRPLLRVWQQLAVVSGDTNTFRREPLPRIDQALEQVQSGLAALRQAEQAAAARIELDPAIRARLREPFQLIDYQNERQLRLEELSRLADQRKVKLGPGVALGFPEYALDRADAPLLWAQLGLLHQALVTAIQCQVTAITSVGVPPLAASAAPTNTGPALVEIPLRIELEGRMAAVTQFLQALPLRPDELKARGLPEPPPGKPALFLDRILLRKQGRDKPDQVQVALTVSGFVYRE
jgi:hypothetical protein